MGPVVHVVHRAGGETIGPAPDRWFLSSVAAASFMRALAAFGPLALVASCYTYTPLSVPAPRVGSRVSAQLTADGTRELTPYLGPNLGTVEGNVLTTDLGEVTLSVLAVEDRRGDKAFWKGETVRLPHYFIAGFDERRFSRAGTVVFGVAFLAGLVGAWEAFRGASGGGGGAGGGGGTSRD